MSLSVGSISAFAPYGSVAALSSNKTRPKAFDLENKSTVSDAFTESAKVNGARGSVEAVPPVQYPTATVEKNKLSAIEKNQEANQAYNAIADSFAGATGYDQGLHAISYAGVGQNVDEYV